MSELELYAKMISDSLSSIKRKEVKVLCPIETEDGQTKAVHPQLTPLVLAYKTVVTLQSAVCNHAPLTSTCGNIGKTIMIGLESTEATEEEKAISRVHIGYYLLDVLFRNNKLAIRRGKKPRDPYTITVTDDAFIDAMLYSVNAEPLKIQMHTKPSFEEPKPFTRFEHNVAGDMVHKINPDAKAHFNYDTCPSVFDTINKAMRTPFLVNTDLLDVIIQCRKDKDPLMSFSNKDIDTEQFIGLKREQTAVIDIANGIGHRQFWQYMFFDFRGRLYSSSIYFSSQGSKLSKNLFYLANKKPIGAEGWYWLLVHAANCFGEDKLTLDDRINFVNSRMDEWMVWAEEPLRYKDWQKADDAFGFLAAIMEIYKAISSPNKYEYQSGLLVAWDATCSGLQVLSALTCDEKAGKLCNLTNSGERGDYYQHIADHIFPECAYNEFDLVTFKMVMDKFKYFDDLLAEANGKLEKTAIYDDRREWMTENTDDVRTATRVFWGRPEIAELKRKIVKRPCMTYFYSCQPKTMARSLMGDFKADTLFKGIQLTFCLWLTSRIYKACRALMPNATQMMDAFIHMGLRDYNDDKDFTIVGPYNQFLCMQNYRNPLLKSIPYQYKGKRIRLKIMLGRGDVLDYHKISSATSPNAVHHLDGQLVSAIILHADYDVNPIHDSFGACPADAGALFEDTRTCFVNIFNDELLLSLEEQKDFNTNIELGKLDVHDVLDDDYTFN